MQVHAVVDGAAEGPTVVFVHGVCLSHRSWDPFVTPLVDDGARVVRVDLRGHGESDRSPGAYDLEGYVGDVVAVLDHLDRPVVLVGHSLGGVTAAAVAQRRPGRVTQLVLEDPALALARPADAPPAGPLLDLFRLIRRAAPSLQASDTTEAQLAARLAGAPTPFGVPAAERYEPDAMHAWAHGQLHLDVRVLDPIIDPPPHNLGPAFDIDAGLAVPTHVLAADLDAPNRVTSREDERRLGASPDVRFERVAGAGHNLHDEPAGRARLLEVLREVV